MPDDPLIGKRLGGFLVQEKIGSGGMGTVYRGLQEGLDRPVAVKVLLGDKAGRSTTVLKRFLREAKSAGQVSHVNVVQVYNAGVADGIHFIAMEYVDGLSVGQLIDRNERFRESEAVKIARQAAYGLQAAARRGLVHRDVKPDNLLITRGGVVKVADFGLVVDTQAETRLTQEGVAIGTIAYMSPEQIRGQQVDHRSDIYSLGATIFHMVAGRPPFIGEGAVILAFKQMNEIPPLLRSLRPEASEGLEAVVHRMMAKDPAARHPTWDEVLEDLDGLAATGRPSSKHTLEFHRAMLLESRPPARSRAFLAVLVAGILGLAGGVFLAVRALSPGPDGPSPAVPPVPGIASGFEVEEPRPGQVLPSPKVAVRGSVNPGAVLAIEVNGARVPLIEGRFRQEVWLDEGSPRVRIQATLADGRTETREIAVRLDSSPPRIEIEEPRGGALHTREAEAVVSGRVRDEGPVRLRVDGADAPLREGKFSVKVPLPGEGERRILVEAADQVGHKASAEVRIFRDLKPPLFTLHEIPKFVEGGDGALRVGFEVNEPLSRLAVNGREIPVSGKVYETTIELREGVNRIRLEATDLAGNAGEHEEEVRFKPKTPPTPAELQKEYEAMLEGALAAELPERERILQEYVSSHSGGPHAAAAQEHLDAARGELHDRAVRADFDRVRKEAEAAEPFEGIRRIRDFLKNRQGPLLEEGRLAVEALRRKNLREGVLRGDEPGVYANEKDGARMVLVPQGDFLRGLPPEGMAFLKNRYPGFTDYRDELPSASVSLDRFFLYRSEVTNAQFARFLETRRTDADDAGHPLVVETAWGLRKVVDRWVPAEGLDNHPVVGVSWFGALEYARWAGGSLPTEAQWEKAASWEPGGGKRLFPWGNTYTHGAAVCADLYAGEEIRKEIQLEMWLKKGQDTLQVLTQVVDSLPEGASPSGCLHMAGNVWEWCLDVYDREFYSSQESRFQNPQRIQGAIERVLRGGGCLSMSRDCRTSNRSGTDPSRCQSDLGFRVARQG